MTLTRALALAACACDFIYLEEAPDVREWKEAAELLRQVLVEVRGRSDSWFWSAGKGPTRQKKKT